MNKLKTMALIASLIALHIGANAQTLTPQQNKKSKWGYVNEAGKAVIKHKYDNARAFSDGLAAVNKGGYWGLINEAGKEVLKCKYNEVRYFSEEGVAIVRSRKYVSNGVYANKFGVVDKTGSFIVPLKYDEIRDFSNGLAVVKGEITVKHYDYTYRKYERWGMIDKTGTIVIPLEYTEISDFSDKLLKAKKDNTWSIIDKTGKVIANYPYIGKLSEGLAKVKSGNKWGYIDKTGKVVIPVEYGDADDFSEGFARVKMANSWKWGIIDNTGTIILPFEYENEKINSMSPSAFVQKEIQRKQEEERQRKLEEEKKEQRKAEILTLFDEIEAVLDNDYYSANCHPVDVLEELIAQTEAIERELYKNYYDDSDRWSMSTRSTDLRSGLRGAINKQQLTKKYGAATAKKIIAGKFEIGMSKALCRAIAYHVTIVGQTANTELWRVSTWKSTRDAYLHFTGDKLVRISY
ncbi:MAG: WG repeat-containing protein [Salinivirgaceae bacterium]